ncbi:MAG: type IX secretion system sortase PorU, partial [Cytophagales bacterium]|nr:type IX secretion system sortase PorU [Cytophaga sp.]
ILVSKIIDYSRVSSSNNGSWKNKMTLVACDGDSNTHAKDAEAIYEIVNVNARQLNVNKIYIDAYQQEATPGGKTAKLVTEAINRDIEDGTLLWNYTGHGGDVVLAQQGIVTPNTINSWTNYNRLPFFITATCGFGRFDKPGLVSGAEQTLLSSKGGSCGNLTSTRTVYQYTNAILNKRFYYHIYERDASGGYISIGDIVTKAKNEAILQNTNVYNRNYCLLADPSMKLCYPKDNIVITSINSVPTGTTADTLKSLSKVMLEGALQDFNGNIISGFNGQANIIVFDKPTNLTTLGTGGDQPLPFKLQNNFIFDGQATVANGLFKITFIVPKDISYQYDYGKISLYANISNGTSDATGYYSNIVIGGSNPNAPADNTPPKVKLYLNDPSFVSGGIARDNPVFFADVSDENGINVSAAGIGHEITLTTSNSTDVIILNKYYSASLDDYTKGKVQYPFSNLAPGTYSLHFKVWDTYNNSSEDVLEFTIEHITKIKLDHVLNYPNPFSTNTTFHFDHNRYGDDLMVQVQVYTVSGILVKTLDETIYNSPSHVSSLSWNGMDDYGDKIGRGVYVYKLKIRSLRDGSTTHVYEKLVLLN